VAVAGALPYRGGIRNPFFPAEEPMPRTYNVLMICGSTRKDAHNKKLLQAIAGIYAEGMQFTHYDQLDALPNYNEDIDTPTPPAAVQALRDAIRRADGIVIASPEYNFSVPGPLKNAIDWASRPYGAGALSGKCMAFFVVTAGRGLGFAGLSELRRLGMNLNNFVVTGPQVVVQEAQTKFVKDAAGVWSLNDAMGCKLIAAHMHGLLTAMQQDAGKLVLAPQAYLQQHNA
jgi:chromate reductase